MDYYIQQNYAGPAAGRGKIDRIRNISDAPPPTHSKVGAIHPITSGERADTHTDLSRLQVGQVHDGNLVRGLYTIVVAGVGKCQREHTLFLQVSLCSV